MAAKSVCFSELGDEIFRKAHGLSRTVRQGRFRALFGVAPTVCAEAWELVHRKLPRNAHPKHLLWALLFLKVYATEHTNSILTGADEKNLESGSG